MIKSLNLKLLVLLEYQNIKIFLRNVTFQIDLKKILWLKKLKILTKRIMKKNQKKQKKENLGEEK